MICSSLENKSPYWPSDAPSARNRKRVMDGRTDTPSNKHVLTVEKSIQYAAKVKITSDYGNYEHQTKPILFLTSRKWKKEYLTEFAIYRLWLSGDSHAH